MFFDFKAGACRLKFMCLALGASLTLAACLPQEGPAGTQTSKGAQEVSIKDPGGHSGEDRAEWSEAEAAQCVAQGGTPKRAGLLGFQVCEKQTSDAGKSCFDSSECEGYCLTPQRQCSAITPKFGCFSIAEGPDSLDICVD